MLSDRSELLLYQVVVTLPLGTGHRVSVLEVRCLASWHHVHTGSVICRMAFIF